MNTTGVQNYSLLTSPPVTVLTPPHSPSLSPMGSPTRSPSLSPRMTPVRERSRTLPEVERGDVMSSLVRRASLRQPRGLPRALSFASVRVAFQRSKNCLCFHREAGFRAVVLLTALLQSLNCIALSSMGGTNLLSQSTIATRPVVIVTGIFQSLQVTVSAQTLPCVCVSLSLSPLPPHSFYPSVFPGLLRWSRPLPQFVVLCLGMAGIIENLQALTLQQACIVYISFTFSFAGFYMLIYLAGEHTFKLDDFRTFNESTQTQRVMKIYCAFCYYSLVTQSLTGFGDIVGRKFTAQYMSMVQSSIGLAFQIVILSQVLARVRSARPSATQRGRCGRLMYWFRRNSLLKYLRRFVRRFLVLIAIVVEAVTYSLVYLSTPNVFHPNGLEKEYISVMVAVQLFTLFLVLFSASKLIRHAEGVGVGFLVQCWLSLTLVFSGLYVCVYLGRADPRPFQLPHTTFDDTSPRSRFWLLLLEMWYFSVATMSSLGYGDIYPRAWDSRVLVCLQMLTAVFFHVILCGIALDRLSKTTSARFTSLVEPAPVTSTATQPIPSDEELGLSVET